MTAILLTDADAERARDHVGQGGARLSPVPAGYGVHWLPLRVLDDPAHAAASWLSDLPTGHPLDALKLAAKAQLAAIRWGKTQLFAYDGVIAYAEPAQGPVLGKIRILEELESTGPIKFKLNATAWRDMTLADLKAYGLAIDAFMQPFYDHEEYRTSQIDAATDFDAVNAIDLDAGWPS